MDDIWQLVTADPPESVPSIYGRCFSHTFQYINHDAVIWWSKWPTTTREVEILRREGLFPLNGAFYESAIGIVLVYNARTRTASLYVPNDPAIHGVKMCFVRSDLMNDLTYYKVDPNIDAYFPPPLRIFLHAVPIRYVAVFASPISNTYIRGDEPWLIYPESFTSQQCERDDYIEWLREGQADGKEVLSLMQRAAPAADVMERELYLQAMCEHYEQCMHNKIQRMNDEFEGELLQLLTSRSDMEKLLAFVIRELTTTERTSRIRNLNSEQRRQAHCAVHAMQTMRESYAAFSDWFNENVSEMELAEKIIEDETHVQNIIDQFICPAVAEIAFVSWVWNVVVHEMRYRTARYVLYSYYIEYIGRTKLSAATLLDYDDQLLKDLADLHDRTGSAIVHRLRTLKNGEEAARRRLDDRVNTVNAYTENDTLIDKWSLDRIHEMIAYHNEQHRLRAERDREFDKLIKLHQAMPLGAKRTTDILHTIISNSTDWGRYLSRVPHIIERNGRSAQDLSEHLLRIVVILKLTAESALYTDNSKMLKALFTSAFTTTLGTGHDSWCITIDQIAMLDTISQLSVESDSPDGVERQAWPGWPYTVMNQCVENGNAFWGGRRSVDKWVEELSEFERANPPEPLDFPFDISPLTSGRHLIVSPNIQALLGKKCMNTWSKLVADLAEQKAAVDNAVAEYFRIIQELERLSPTMTYNQMRDEAQKLCRPRANVDSNEWWWGLVQYLGTYGTDMTPTNPYRVLMDVVDDNNLIMSRSDFVEMLASWTVDYRITALGQLSILVDKIVDHLRHSAGVKCLFKTSTMLIRERVQSKADNWRRSTIYDPPGFVPVASDECLEGLFADGTNFIIEDVPWNSFVPWPLRQCIGHLRQTTTDRDVCAQLPKWIADADSKWVLSRGTEYDEPNASLSDQHSFMDVLFYSAISALTLETLLYHIDEVMSSDEFTAFTLNGLLGTIHPYAAIQRLRYFGAPACEDTAVLYQRFQGLEYMTDDFNPPDSIHRINDISARIAKIAQATNGKNASKPVLGLSDAIQLLSDRFANEQFRRVARARAAEAMATNKYSMFFVSDTGDLRVIRRTPSQLYTFDKLRTHAYELSTYDKLNDIRAMRFVKNEYETGPITSSDSARMYGMAEDVGLRVSLKSTPTSTELMECWVTQVGRGYQLLKDQDDSRSEVNDSCSVTGFDNCPDDNVFVLADLLDNMQLESRRDATIEPLFALVDPFFSTTETGEASSVAERNERNEISHESRTTEDINGVSALHLPVIYKIYSNDLKAYFRLKTEINELTHL